MVVSTELEAWEDKCVQPAAAAILPTSRSNLTIYVLKSGGCSSLPPLVDKVPMFTTSALLAGGSFRHAVSSKVTVHDAPICYAIRFKLSFQQKCRTCHMPVVCPEEPMSCCYPK